MRYLRGWFIIDFISVVPIDIIMLASTTGSEGISRLKTLRMFRLFRLLKLLRILRGARIFARWEVRVAVNYNLMSLYQALANLVLLAHWFACLIGLVDSLQVIITNVLL